MNAVLCTIAVGAGIWHMSESLAYRPADGSLTFFVIFGHFGW